MKNKIFYFLTLILFTAFTACEEPAEPTGIAFITFEEASKSYVIDEGSTFTTDYTIYTATKASSDITLDLSVTGSLAAANYTVPTTVTIPAGSNEGTFTVSIVENNLDKINGETMVISFTSPEGFYDGETELAIKVDVFCPSQIAGSYVYSDGNGAPATITAGVGVNNFVISRDNAFGAPYAIEINDQCGAIAVTGGDIVGLGIPISGTGTVMANGNIVLSYTVDGYFANRTMTLVRQ